SLSVGSHSITAAYGGDNNYSANTSAAITQVIDTPPAGLNDAYSVLKDAALVVGAPGVLGNDADADAGQTLTATLLAGPGNASSFALYADGSFSYTPTPDSTGVDSFLYRAKNASNVQSNLAMVTITVLAANASVVAANDAFTADQDTPLTIPAPGVLGNDSGATAAARVSGPLYGALVLQPDGGLIYTPNSSFSGEDSFTYRASNGTTSSNLAMATILVRATTTIAI